MPAGVDTRFRAIEDNQAPKLQFANNYYINGTPDDELYAMLGALSEKPELDRGYRALRLDSLKRSAEEIGLGRKIFRAWSRALHGFLCEPSSDDKELVEKVLQAIFSNKGGGAALLAGLLVTSFNLAPATAAIVAALAIKLVFVPAANEVCAAWDQNLKGA